ncbi:hypothetical protein DPMN_041739 [Dreissena polymorpha]|uniref:Uncharacterized protein n=1 Tax=Dreissena polymorpha TaxID=45954 RepID=A0A9D4CZY5_DREPO|nr:hypothetical protein DPMN_041739 [Dreissena polymorpha]
MASSLTIEPVTKTAITDDKPDQHLSTAVSMPNPRPDIVKASNVPRSDVNQRPDTVTSPIALIKLPNPVDKKMLFKLKTGVGFVCEHRKMFTKE